MRKKIRYLNRYPKIDSLDLFSERFEKSYIYEAKAVDLIIKNILKILPVVKRKRKIIASTYFEKVLSYQPQETCDVRFRQSITGGLNYGDRKFPKKWILGGSGNLEVKIRDFHRRKKVDKYASFLPDNKGGSVYSLIRLASKQNEDKIIIFLNKINQLQIANTEESLRGNLRLIPPWVIKMIYMYLAPFATRVNIRHTFEILKPQKARITMETLPHFYAYPISHRTHEHISYKRKYEAKLMEAPQRCKIDIKTKTKSFNNDISKSILSGLGQYLIQDNEYSSLPYYKMVLNESKRRKVIIDERQGKEVEAKANILEQIEISNLIQIIKSELLNNKVPYKLFATEPNVSVRKKAELNRTIIGWIDRQKIPHEVVTSIRLKDKAKEKYGVSTILKWKTDNRLRNSQIMSRGEKKELLNGNINNITLLKRACRLANKKLKIIGSFRKEKQRIVVQDSNGRNFVVSLDESRLWKNKSILRQLEVEYAHTVKIGKNYTISKPLEDSCIECLNYFVKLLKKLGVRAEKTNLRKIDFVAEHSS